MKSRPRHMYLHPTHDFYRENSYERRPRASPLEHVRLAAPERVGLEGGQLVPGHGGAAAARGEQLGLLLLVLDGRGALDLAAHDLDDGDDGQQQQADGQPGAEAPALLGLVGERHGRLAEGLRQHEQARRRADGAGRHEHEPHELRDAVQPLPARVQVPRGGGEDERVARDDGHGAEVRQARVGRGGRRVGRAGGRVRVPHARDGQRRLGQVALHGAEHEGAVRAAEGQVDEHEGLAQPAQHPVAPEVVHQRQQRRVVHRHGQQRQHPDEEEVVRHHLVHLRQPHHLDADARHDLLVRVRVQQLAPHHRRLAAQPPPPDELLLEHEGDGEDERDARCDDETEENLCSARVSQPAASQARTHTHTRIPGGGRAET